MNSEPSDRAIVLDGVSKRFHLNPGGTRTLKAMVMDRLRGRRSGRSFYALRDVSFRVRRGETLGLIGANGAGKSTLLSIVAGTMQPTEGTVETHGTISSLLELGAGFHPDLTGRENIFLYGAIMGIPRRRMRERFDAIVSFAGIGDFIDQPVKHYSSGMYVRLGFAVAVEVDPDILLIDEVLAVGDASFQRKCIDKMAEFRERGKTLLIISHDLPTIQSVSDRIMLLEKGRVIDIGDPASVVGHYQSLSRKERARAMEREWGTGEVVIERVTIGDAEEHERDVFTCGETLTARIHYRAKRRVASPVFGFSISTEAGLLVHGSNTQLAGIPTPDLDVGPGSILLKISPLMLGRGDYLFSFSVHSPDHKTNYHRVENRYPIAVEDDSGTEGCVKLTSSWTL